MSHVSPRMLPLEVLQDKQRSAEVKVYNQLVKQLQDQWHVFYNIRWLLPVHGQQPEDGQWDFLIAHRDKGVLVIEVKGGRVRKEDGQWLTLDRSGKEHRIDPIEQVIRQKYALRNALYAELGQIQESLDLGHALIFPDTFTADEFYGIDAPHGILIGKEHENTLLEKLEKIFRFLGLPKTGTFHNGDKVIDTLYYLCTGERYQSDKAKIEQAQEEGATGPAPSDEDQSDRHKHRGRLIEIRKVYPRAYESWSKSEETLLSNLFVLGWPVETIADCLGRQPGAIIARLDKIHPETTLTGETNREHQRYA